MLVTTESNKTEKSIIISRQELFVCIMRVIFTLFAPDETRIRVGRENLHRMIIVLTGLLLTTPN